MMRDSGKPPYEADFVYFNLNTLHLTEVEIKTDINDFKNDFKKARYHDNHNVMYLYYADTFDCRGNIYEFGGFVKKAKRIKGSVKLNEQEKEYYMRIGCMKWVNR